MRTGFFTKRVFLLLGDQAEKEDIKTHEHFVTIVYILNARAAVKILTFVISLNLSSLML